MSHYKCVLAEWTKGEHTKPSSRLRTCIVEADSPQEAFHAAKGFVQSKFLIGRKYSLDMLTVDAVSFPIMLDDELAK